MLKRRDTKKVHLTKKAIEICRAKDGRRTTIYDSQIPGLGVLIQPQPSGTKSFFWFRKVRDKLTWKTRGEFPAVTVEQARDWAQDLNAKLAKWKGDEFRGPNPFGRTSLTLGDVLEDYVARHLQSNSKNPDRTVKGIRWQLDKYAPGWKTRRIDAIHRKDVLDLYNATREQVGVFTGNRLVQMLKALFNWAIHEMEWAGENPARIKLVNEKRFRRMRYLEGDELVRLVKELSVEPQRDLRDFVVLSLFTGARMSDVLGMRWENLRLENPAGWTVPDPKSTIPYIVPLLDEPLGILKERLENKKVDSPWVFPSRDKTKTGHVTGFKHSWPALLKRAKLEDLRIHDLRRTFGSWLAKTGTSLHMVGRALGHESLGATSIYAQIADSALRASQQRAFNAMPAKVRKALKP